MQQLRVYFPNRSIEKEGIGSLIDDLRRANVRTVNTVLCTGDRGVFRIGLDEVLEEGSLATNDAVTEFKKLTDSPPEYLIVLSPPFPWMLFDDCPAALLCEQELVFRDDGLEVTIIVTQAEVEELSTHITQSNISCEILSIGAYRGCSDGATDSLTRRQQDVLQHAHDRGYYDVPRRTTLSELANDLGIDQSTVAEHLRRAENNMFTHVLSEKC